MQQPWEIENSPTVRAHYTLYTIPQAAALWCEIPEDQLPGILEETRCCWIAEQEVLAWTHPKIAGIESRSRAISEAIKSGELVYVDRHGNRPSGVEAMFFPFEDRHLYGKDLKAWLERAFPNEKPPFLFGGTASVQLNDNKQEDKQGGGRQETAEKRARNDSRSVTALLNIIGALEKELIADASGEGRLRKFPNRTALIRHLNGNYADTYGLSESNLGKKLPAAEESLQAARKTAATDK